MRASAIEHSTKAMFEVVALSHGHSGGKRERTICSGDLQELRGVICGPLAGQDNTVVAGQLALDSQATQSVPGKRMKPIQRASQPAQQLKADVIAFDMG